MLDWYLILTPLLVLPIAVLFVFVGCTLLESPLAPYHPVHKVTFTIEFHASHAGDVTEFIVVVDITPEDGDPIPPLYEDDVSEYEDDASDDPQENRWYLCELETDLRAGEFTVQCSVLPYTGEGQIIASRPYPLRVEDDCQVSFKASRDAEVLDVTIE